MDILAALTNHQQPTTRTGRCKLQRHLDNIPNEHPGKDDLLTALNAPNEWSATRLALVFKNLGLDVGVTTIRVHRAHTCTCYIGG